MMAAHVGRMHPGDGQLFVAGYATMRVYFHGMALDINDPRPGSLALPIEFIPKFRATVEDEFGPWTILAMEAPAGP